MSINVSLSLPLVEVAAAKETVAVVIVVSGQDFSHVAELERLTPHVRAETIVTDDEEAWLIALGSVKALLGLVIFEQKKSHL